MDLFEYQKTGVAFLKERQYALLADDMGLGKTIQAATAVKDYRNICVVCPAQTKTQWSRALGSVGIGNSIDVYATGSVVTNYERIIKPKVISQLKKRHFDCVIVDEAHYLQTHDSQRTRKILHGLRHYSDRMWFLTGTPVMSNPVNLFSILQASIPERLGRYKTWYPFAKRFCGMRDTEYGLKCFAATNTEELRCIIGDFMLRRMQEDVDIELPDIRIADVCLEETPFSHENVAKQRDMYLANDHSEDFEFLNERLALDKVEQSVSFIKEKLLMRDKVLVFAHHKAVIRALEVHLSLSGIKTVTYYGDNSNNAKAQAKHAFISGDARVFIGGVMASGTGLDGLQEVCDTAIFVELPWVPSIVEQAIGRLKRIGQKRKSVIAYVLRYPGSIDEVVLKRLEEKETVVGKVMRSRTTVSDRESGDIVLTKQEGLFMGIEQDLQNIAKGMEELVRLVGAISARGATAPAEKKTAAVKSTTPVQDLTGPARMTATESTAVEQYGKSIIVEALREAVSYADFLEKVNTNLINVWGKEAAIKNKIAEYTKTLRDKAQSLGAKGLGTVAVEHQAGVIVFIKEQTKKMLGKDL